MEFHLREAELELEARGGRRAKRSFLKKKLSFLLWGMTSVTHKKCKNLSFRSTTMGGLLHPSWSNKEETEVGGGVDDFTEDGNEEEEEEEEESRGGGRKRSSVKKVQARPRKYVGAMAWFFPVCEWFVPWNGSVHFLPTGHWYSLK